MTFPFPPPPPEVHDTLSPMVEALGKFMRYTSELVDQLRRAHATIDALRELVRHHQDAADQLRVDLRLRADMQRAGLGNTGQEKP